MRERWQTASRLWEDNKALANNLNLLSQLDYYGKLSAQLDWQTNFRGRSIRVVYNQSGAPTAALVKDDSALIDYTLFWVACRDSQEANYLVAIINSQALYEAVAPMMAKGQFGARHLQKHLWTLPIPEFGPNNPLHVRVSRAGEAAAQGAAKQLARLRQYRGQLSVTIARRELRSWLRTSDEGKSVEDSVTKLLAGG